LFLQDIDKIDANFQDFMMTQDPTPELVSLDYILEVVDRFWDFKESRTSKGGV